MSQWKGVRVLVPGDVFFEPGKTWEGVVTGVVPTHGVVKKKSVYIKFDDDDKKYWFKMADVLDWVVDKEKIDILRPTIQAYSSQKTASETSIVPSSEHSDQDEPAPHGTTEKPQMEETQTVVKEITAAGQEIASQRDSEDDPVNTQASRMGVDDVPVNDREANEEQHRKFYSPLPFTPLPAISRKSGRKRLLSGSTDDDKEKHITQPFGNVPSTTFSPIHGFRMLNNPPSDDEIEPAGEEEPYLTAPRRQDIGFNGRLARGFKRIFALCSTGLKPTLDEAGASSPEPVLTPRPAKRQRLAGDELSTGPSLAPVEDEHKSQQENHSGSVELLDNGGEAMSDRSEEVEEMKPIKWNPAHVFSSMTLMGFWGSFIYNRCLLKDTAPDK